MDLEGLWEINYDDQPEEKLGLEIRKMLRKLGVSLRARGTEMYIREYSLPKPGRGQRFLSLTIPLLS